MILLTIIIFTILVLLIILNIKKDGFTNPKDEDLQKHINDIKHFAVKHSKDIDRNLYYYPYNDIYNKYKKSMLTYLCKKKGEVDAKNEEDEAKLQTLKDTYQNLRRKISPDFNPIFGDFLQLNTYNSDNNPNLKYLKVKRHIDEVDNTKKSTFQIYTNGTGTQCLEVDNQNNYKLADCDEDEEQQRFNIDFAYDQQSYEEIVKNPRARYPEKAELLNYPISLLRAKNGNCVNLYDDKLSIEPCKYKSTQMFKMKPV